MDVVLMIKAGLAVLVLVAIGGIAIVAKSKPHDELSAMRPWGRRECKKNTIMRW